MEQDAAQEKSGTAPGKLRVHPKEKKVEGMI
jgi:hypothetical protein